MDKDKCKGCNSLTEKIQINFFKVRNNIKDVLNGYKYENWNNYNKQNWCLLWVSVHHSLGMGLIFIASRNILINPVYSIWSLLLCFGICIPVTWYYTKEYNNYKV